MERQNLNLTHSYCDHLKPSLYKNPISEKVSAVLVVERSKATVLKFVENSWVRSLGIRRIKEDCDSHASF